MAKEDARDNSFGVASVIFGVLGVAFSVTIIFGLAFSILAFVFALLQRKRHKNSWATAGIILSAVGVVLSVIIIISLASLISNVQETVAACTANPSLPGCEQFSQYLQQQGMYNAP